MAAKEFMDFIKDIKLTWPEARVLFHFYFRKLPVDEVADAVGCHVADVSGIRRSLLKKVAKRLQTKTKKEGYLGNGTL